MDVRKNEWTDKDFIAKKVEQFHKRMAAFRWRNTETAREGKVIYSLALSYLQHEFNRLPLETKVSLSKIYDE